MSLPMMISMVVQALYNVVDSIFVSWLSEDALAAVTLVFPVQSLMIAFGAGLDVYKRQDVLPCEAEGARQPGVVKTDEKIRER